MGRDTRLRTLPHNVDTLSLLSAGFASTKNEGSERGSDTRSEALISAKYTSSYLSRPSSACAFLTTCSCPESSLNAATMAL